MFEGYRGIIGVHSGFDTEIFISDEQIDTLSNGKTLTGKIMYHGTERVEDLTLKFDPKLNGVNFLDKVGNQWNFRVHEELINNVITTGRIGEAYSGRGSGNNIFLYRADEDDWKYAYNKQKIELNLILQEHERDEKEFKNKIMDMMEHHEQFWDDPIKK